MDCDFSHDPSDVSRMLAAVEHADVVLGSRYVEGGRVENWGAFRRFVSSGGSLYARVLLGVGIRDLTGGFKCYRRQVLEAIDLDAVTSTGYAFRSRRHTARSVPASASETRSHSPTARQVRRR